VEGLVDWVKGYAERKSLPFPPLDIQEPSLEVAGEQDSSAPAEESKEMSRTAPEPEEGVGEGETAPLGDADRGSTAEMFVGMYQTAIDMVLDQAG
jgi:hypothetical protein